MVTISQRELRNESGEVMRRVEAGERFTVTRRGVPIADLVPHRVPTPDGPSRFASADRITETMSGVPDWDSTAFEAEQRVLDARVDDDTQDPWAR